MLAKRVIGMEDQILTREKKNGEKSRNNIEPLKITESGQSNQEKGDIRRRNSQEDPVVVAVIPALNEDRFIGSLVIKIQQYVDRVIVVDDGSTDKTTQVAKMAGAEVLRHPSNQGKGQALKSGFHRAKELNADVVVVLDGDGQHRPSEIPRVVQPIIEEGVDMVIGTRFGEKKNAIPAWRQFGQHALTWVTNISSGVHSTDSQSGFRAFAARSLDNLYALGDGFSVESEMQFVAAENDLQIHEVPITCYYHEKGKRNPFLQGLQVLNGIYRLISRTRPLVFFGMTGLIFTILGLIGWGWVLETYNQSGLLALSFMLLSTLSIIIGVLFAFEGIILNVLHCMGANLIDKQLKAQPLVVRDNRKAEVGTSDLPEGDAYE
jgi:glycosyltransferase involved in cell wall biosynthesis